MQEVLADLQAETEDLIDVVAPLEPDQWDLVTPAEPWTIRDQIGHLAFFDEKAALAASHPERFNDEFQTVADLGMDGYLDQHIVRARSMPPTEVLAWFRGARAQLLDALGAHDPDDRLPWYGPPMRAESSATARLMETWAHGLDIADTLGVVRAPTDRLVRIADLGVRTFRFSYENRGLGAPEDRVRVALRSPGGNMVVWNDEWDQSVTGPVEEFCQVIAQRRHVDDTHLVMEGPLARQWMELAQVFAGPPGPGRQPTGVQDPP
jgi:uncharacterized protein (TIGR03084 family)